MSRFRVSRRALLRGGTAGLTVGLGLPTLEAMLNGNGTAYAQGQALPKRFGVWFWGLGVKLAKWVPVTQGPNWAVSEELVSLMPVKEYVSVVSGMDVYIPRVIVHHTGQGAILTATPLRKGAGTYSTPTVPSIDQVAAGMIGKTTRFKSLEVGVSRRGTLVREGPTVSSVSHNGAESMNLPEYNPSAVYAKLLGAAPGASTAATARTEDLLATRRSVLDLVKADMASLMGRVGTADRRRLDLHLENIRGIERQLKALPPSAGACKGVDPGAPPAESRGEPMEAVNKAMADLTTLALACDLTRVFTFAFSMGSAGPLYWQIGSKTGQHTVTHNEAEPQPTVHAGVLFIMKQLAYFLQALKSTPDGAGNLLDSLALLGTSELAEGRSHSTRDFPILVIGKAGGALRHPGVHYRSPSAENATTVLLSLLRAVGLPLAEFGAGGGRATASCSAIEA